MSRPKKNSTVAKGSAATVGYEAELWQMANADFAWVQRILHHPMPIGIAGNGVQRWP